MSEEQLKAFQEKVQGDTSLQEKLNAAADAVAAIAKEAGFQIDIEELKNDSRDITEEEMAIISGGRGFKEAGFFTWGNDWGAGKSFRA